MAHVLLMIHAGLALLRQEIIKIFFDWVAVKELKLSYCNGYA